MSSDAVGSERLSRVVGYKITKGDFANTTPNLPQRIAILGEANAANQSGLTTAAYEINSAKDAGDKFGYGSPIHMAARILYPVNSDGIGGIPTIVYPQLEGAAVAAEFETTVTGTATGNATHKMYIAGRDILDGDTYDLNIVTGDTPTLIAAKIKDAMNAVLGCPFIGTSALGVATHAAKWKGLTGEDLTISFDTQENSVGVTYATVSSVTGTTTPSVSASLALFGTDWNTIVINTYGAVAATMTELEAFNGVPDPIAPTGRFQGIIMKPFIALTGSVAQEDAIVTDSKKDQVTIAICPAPLSAGHPLEAAANMALLFGRVSQDTPHLDVEGRFYPDMPTTTSAIDMDTYSNRDSYVKLGNSTVDISGGKYRIQDFVTTYHPVGENPAQFRYCRNLMLDFNVRFGYYMLEQINVVDHVIAANDDVVEVGNVIKPKQWIGILNNYFEDLAKRALITDPGFAQDSLVVDLSGVNPDRLETFFRYKRTGMVRIAATTAEAGFNFG